MRQPKSFGFTRFWIIFSSIFGIIGVVIMSIAYFYYLDKFNNGTLNNVDPNTAEIFLMNSYSYLGSFKVILLIAIMFTLFSTIICNIGLIRYAAKSTDEELCANKWSLAVLSLSLGGFFAPFALTWLPDTDVKATKNARVTIVRYLGTSWLLGAIFSIVAIMVFYARANDHSWTKVGDYYPANPKQVFTAVIAVLAVASALSLLFVPWFYNQNTVAHMIAETSLGKWYRFISTLYTVIVTMLLIIQIITAVLKLIEIFTSIFQNNQGAGSSFISIMRFTMSLISTMFMIYLIVKVIAGLWKRSDNYMISIPQYREADQTRTTY
ncbi:hypothetical protein P344_04000 [Spiroplasma mirum ATCC 29335]|uniref:Uncharacterized protein n=1 Tax=Spiroplasma mirum ATCC 29335 TaxID=838561 RepID=W0GR47_9MOLU|nr:MULTISPECIES: hypothetical protein [Spiroplasma]AHF61089.1 putative transmembrane protein [Spiroplasma mirum ATCC 29335]AHI58128.1 hypothetical protein P344_04000 [Spiroplasma mirum ATCC 29335]AKM53184.1 hypothetical protein SATRI_v1c07300 [Spiroplasma atrichopogonis]